MIKTPMTLQDLRRRIYAKAKADSTWRFWGLYVHVCKMETLREAYLMAKKNGGAPGLDGVTFEAIEEAGVEAFLQRIRDELTSQTYRPQRNRRKEIPKDDGKKVRTLSIPSIRDRVVQGALKLVMEPVFEADFQPGSFGYRPRRKAHDAFKQVTEGIARGKTKVLDVDLRAFFDNVRHDLLLRKVAQRIQDDQILRLLKLILKATGKKGVSQGGVLSPLLSNVYLNEVDKMLEKAKAVTRKGRHTAVEYARYADDMVILIDGHPRHEWLGKAVDRRLREELTKLHVELNEEKSRTVDLTRDECFGFLGFELRRVRSRQGKWRPHSVPKPKKRTALLRELKGIFRHHRSQPIGRVVEAINPILRGWANYFRVGNSTRCFTYVRRWVEMKVRRHLMRAREEPGYGWKRWSSLKLHRDLGLYCDYRIRYYTPGKSTPGP